MVTDDLDRGLGRIHVKLLYVCALGTLPTSHVLRSGVRSVWVWVSGYACLVCVSG